MRLSAEVVINFAQQKFVRVGKRGLQYYADYGTEETGAVVDMLRLDGIIRALSTRPAFYSYQDLEELLAVIQNICDPEQAVNYKPLRFFPYTPTTTVSPVFISGLYRGPWFEGAQVDPKTLWKEGRQLYASTRSDSFTSLVSPAAEGNTYFERVGELLDEEVGLQHLSQEVKDYIDSKSNITPGSVTEATEYIDFSGSPTFTLTTTPNKILRVELKSKNRNRFLHNSDLRLGIDYLWTGGTKAITIIREGLTLDEDDFLVVQSTKGGTTADMTLYEPTFSFLPTGLNILWDFDNKFVSNRLLPEDLAANVNISGSGFRNGLRVLLEVKQNATGDFKVLFNTGGVPSELPVNTLANTITVLEGWFNGTNFYWNQKFTALAQA